MWRADKLKRLRSLRYPCAAAAAITQMELKLCKACEEGPRKPNYEKRKVNVNV